MELEVGKAGKARFIRCIKKTNIFECGSNGLVLEREKNRITLYATNNRCSEIYAVVPLGGSEILKKNKFVGVAYSRDIMLLDGGDIMVMVDFAQKKVAVNKTEIKVTGKKDWAENVQLPWCPEYNVMFGMAANIPVMEEGQKLSGEPVAQEPVQEEPLTQRAEKFWQWFTEHEDEIIDLSSAGGDQEEIINARVRARLALVFSYERPGEIEFSLNNDGEKNVLSVYHFNKEKMRSDAQELGTMMPNALKENWKYETEA